MSCKFSSDFCFTSSTVTKRFACMSILSLGNKKKLESYIRWKGGWTIGIMPNAMVRNCSMERAVKADALSWWRNQSSVCQKSFPLNWTPWHFKHFAELFNGLAMVSTNDGIDFVDLHITSWYWGLFWPGLVFNLHVPIFKTFKPHIPISSLTQQETTFHSHAFLSTICRHVFGAMEKNVLLKNSHGQMEALTWTHLRKLAQEALL